jgi:hypothetical protein
MAKMRMEPSDRPRVKLACLRMLARLQLDPARRELISGFVDSYLRLTIHEEEAFEAELAAVEPREKEEVMEIVTSWMEKGLEQGHQEGTRVLVLRQLRKRLGGLDEAAEARVRALPTERLEELGEALLDFSGPDDLAAWLEEHSQ